MDDKITRTATCCNDSGIVQYASVKIGNVLEGVKNFPEDIDLVYIDIGYYDTRDNVEYNVDHPHTDIDICISGDITINDNMSLIRHFGNDPGKMLYLYERLSMLVDTADSSIEYEDIFTNISDRIFGYLKEWVHPIEVPTVENLLKYTPRFVDLKYRSTFLGIVVEYEGGGTHYNNLVRLNNRLTNHEPLLLLHKLITEHDEEFLIYPDGRIILNSLPLWVNFKAISKFGGEEILLFCEKCSNLYKSVNGDISNEDAYNKYEGLIEELLQNLYFRKVREGENGK